MFKGYYNLSIVLKFYESNSVVIREGYLEKSFLKNLFSIIIVIFSLIK